MACLYKRRTQYWASYYLNGRQVQKSLHTDDPRIARDKIRKLEYELSLGDLPQASRLPLPTLLETFCGHLKSRQTYRSYRKDVSRLRNLFGEICEALKIKPAGSPARRQARPRPDKYAGDHINAKLLEDVTTEVINRFLDSRVRRSQWWPKTANGIRELLHRLFEYAIRHHGFCSRDRRHPNPASAVERRREPAPDQINRTLDYRPDRCPDCGAALRPVKRPPRTLQQVELPEIPLVITEHRAHAAWCPHCRRTHYAVLPPEVEKAGLVGPRLSALVAWLKGAGHCSFSTTGRFCRDVLRLGLSRGQLAKVVGKAGDAMRAAYDALAARLPEEPCLNVDETGHKEKGDALWTWVFRASRYTVFKIDPSRGSEVLIDALGREFAGVLGCDYFSAYRKYMGDFDVLVQFCLAHLIRDVKFLVDLPDPVTAAYGRRLLEELRRLFHVIHRRETMEAARFRAALERARDRVLKVGKGPPPRIEARNLADRFRRHGAAYFRFITTPGIEPTNNLAEQAIRFVVQDRHVTQGTRSPRGRRWSERIWTATATCAQQGRSVFDYLHQTLVAHFAGHPTPSLLPAGP